MRPELRQALKAEMDKVLEERARLDVVIDYLAGRLGLDADSMTRGKRHERHEVPADAIGKGQLEGKSATKAARQVLRMFGPERPLKTQELFDALAKGGVRVKNTNGLHRSLNRDATFRRVERGLWSLAEWYPKPDRERTHPDPAGPAQEPGEVEGAPSSAETARGDWARPPVFSDRPTSDVDPR